MRPWAGVWDVSAGARLGGRVMAGFAMASPEAARAEASPPEAVFLRGGERPRAAGPEVVERGRGGGGPGLEVRRQGLRFLLVALLTEWMEAASELSGTLRVEPKEGDHDDGAMVSAYVMGPGRL